MSPRSALAFALALLLAACQRGDAPSPAAPGPSTASGAEAAAGATGPDADDAPAPDAGVEVPRLVVTTLDGERYDLADRRGRWVVVNFWATWCSPCLKEMPELSALDVMREHIEVIGLAYEEIQPEALRAFLAERPVAYPVAVIGIYDPPADFPTPRGLPLTVLIAPDGRAVRTFLGPVTALELEQAIEAAGGPAPGEGA